MGQRTSFSSTQSKANLPMKGWSSHKTLTQLYPLPFYGQLPKPCPWIPLPHGFQQSWLWTLLLVRGAAPAYTLGLGKLRGASYALLAASQSERDPHIIVPTCTSTTQGELGLRRSQAIRILMHNLGIVPLFPLLLQVLRQ